jgi:molecular chaperone HtpG
MTDLKSETRDFSAEVGKVLHLMINALYTNKDTCLRELISNAADACDKLRYLSQFDSSLCGSHSETKISICIDKQNHTLSVKDSGIGMNKEDLLNYLGGIASSGTQRFLEKMTGDDKNDNTLIGQFGVGFYSVFMIGDAVEVKTRKAGDDQSYLWASKGSGSYTISNLEEKCEGTEVIVHLKESETNYLDFDYVKSVILKYSDNIAVPIFLEESLDQRSDQINSAKALWTLNRSEISQDQYKEFYQRVFYASDSPWKILHNKNEGSGSFTNLLFIPSEKTFDLFSSDRKRRVKLYVKRVFVTEEGIDLIPYYLRFVRGVIDTDSLSLNISREMIQSSSVLATIRRVVTSRVLKVLKEALQSETEEYKIFWANFGAVLKEGLCEDAANSEALLELCLFYSAMQKRHVTLNQYLENQSLDGQKNIYYITGESLQSLSNSPQIEGFLKQNVDVLLMTDAVDSFWLSMVSQYKGVSFVSVAKANMDIPNASLSSDKTHVSKDESEALCKYFKECLGALVKDVQISKKLVDSPACLVVAEGSMDARMERFLLSQNHISSVSAKVMEINFDHPIISQISSKVSLGNCDEATKDLVLILFDQVLLAEGENIKDVQAFCTRVHKLITRI